MVDYLVVIDFEANAQRHGVIYPQEITEFPGVIIDVAHQTIDRKNTFQQYCKIKKRLDPFATELTGITQEQVDAGQPFPIVLEAFMKWLRTSIPSGHSYLVVTCGDWDFRTCFPKQCNFSGIPVPPIFTSWCNVKKIYCQVLNRRRAGGMKAMLENLGLPLRGRHHSGIDDALNIAEICLYLLRCGALFEVTGTLQDKRIRRVYRWEACSKKKQI
uniref:Exonuclease domain-containing protein n=1 Tax=viral metagenome TaxID=1070528 RepID=A0A6C0BNH4_9ZZZZ